MGTPIRPVLSSYSQGRRKTMVPVFMHTPWPRASRSPPIQIRRSSQLQSLGVTRWPTWGCGVSTFPWTYDEQETYLLLEGDVSVTPAGGEPVRFGAGDLVVLNAGLSCTWDVHAPVRKHYRFG